MIYIYLVAGFLFSFNEMVLVHANSIKSAIPFVQYLSFCSILMKLALTYIILLKPKNSRQRDIYIYYNDDVINNIYLSNLMLMADCQPVTSGVYC